MYVEGLSKLYWGSLFIIVDFRILGFNILPDIVGFIFFVMGFCLLASGSEFFVKAKSLNIPMIVLLGQKGYSNSNQEIDNLRIKVKIPSGGARWNSGSIYS